MVRAYVRWVAISVPILLAANRFALRPWLAAMEEPPSAWVVFSGSFPNFLEAILGMLVLSILFRQLSRSSAVFGGLSDPTVYWAACSATAIYVISQELNWHRLGGRNVYDPYDVVASVIGLCVMTAIVLRFGVALADSNTAGRSAGSDPPPRE